MPPLYPDLETYIRQRIEEIREHYVGACRIGNSRMEHGYYARFDELRNVAVHIGMEVESRSTFLKSGL